MSEKTAAPSHPMRGLCRGAKPGPEGIGSTRSDQALPRDLCG